MKSIKPSKNSFDTYAEVDLKVLKKNFELIGKEANRIRKNPRKRTMICSVVKANAYGHGMCNVAEALHNFGSEYLGTAYLSESIELRKHLDRRGKKTARILCLGLLRDKKKYFEEVLKNRIEVTLSDVKAAKTLDKFASSLNKKVNVHIKLDTGMNRIGFTPDVAIEAVREISKLKNLNLKGIYSHFATSEVPGSSFAKSQLKTFVELVSEIENNAAKFELKHIENSGGILNFRNDFCNMVRPGIALYGYYPDRTKLKKNIGIQPVMTLKSKVSLVKTVGRGESVSYGRKYYTKGVTKIASIPVGYGDGYSRLLTNKSKVYINGGLYKVVGTVCMDWIMADIGKNSDINEQNEVILFGKEYPAHNLSDIMQTIPYEIITNVSSRVQRIYV